MASYLDILQQNPGKALQSGEGIFAVLTTYEGELYVHGVHAEDDGSIIA